MKPDQAGTKFTPITIKMANKFHKWAKPEFDPEVISFPLCLCKTCRVRLAECEKQGGNGTGIKATWDNFMLKNIHVPRGQDASTCSCDMGAARKTSPIGKNRGQTPTNLKIIARGEPQKEKEIEKKKKASAANVYRTRLVEASATPVALQPGSAT